MANWALDLRSGAAVFAGIGALLVSAGIFATKLLTSGGEIGHVITSYSIHYTKLYDLL